MHCALLPTNNTCQSEPTALSSLFFRSTLHSPFTKVKAEDSIPILELEKIEKFATFNFYDSRLHNFLTSDENQVVTFSFCTRQQLDFLITGHGFSIVSFWSLSIYIFRVLLLLILKSIAYLLKVLEGIFRVQVRLQ